MPEPKHTLGAAALAPHGNTTLVIGKRHLASCGGYSSNIPGEEADRENEANARRLAACWNASDGISTESLEAGLVKELVGTLERAQAGLQWWIAECPQKVTDADHEMQDEIDAILAKTAAA